MVDAKNSSLNIQLTFISTCPCCLSPSVQAGEGVFSPFFSLRALELSPIRIPSGKFDDLEFGTSYFPVPTLFCTDCKSVSAGVRLDDKSLERYYEGYLDEEFIEQRIGVEPSFGRRMLGRSNQNTLRKRGEQHSYSKLIDGYFSTVLGDIPLEILDFGGGTGANTPFRESSDCSVFEIDSEEREEHLLNRQWPAISMMNVLEHMMDPVDELAKVGKLLEPSSGRVLIEVPLETFMHQWEDAPDFWRRKFIWTEHFNCFSPPGLEACIREAGLELVAPVELLEVASTSEELRENGFIMLAACRVPAPKASQS